MGTRKSNCKIEKISESVYHVHGGEQVSGDFALATAEIVDLRERIRLVVPIDYGGTTIGLIVIVGSY